MKFNSLSLILTFLLSLPLQAQMSSHLKEEFHDAEAYGVQIVEGVSSLRAALGKEDTRVLSFQSYDESVGEESVAELLEWVRAGNTVWFYDARLAPRFGMRPTYLTGEEFRNKPEDGVLGGKKRQGLATVAVSFGTHAVQTGVGQVTIFMPEIFFPETDEPSFGAIEVAGDTVPLLQFALDSPALVACRREGKGFIVFKSLLWNEPLSGDRFQGNLLEYSAGFQVPGPAGVGKVGHPPGPEAEFIVGEPAEVLTAQAVDGSHQEAVTDTSTAPATPPIAATTGSGKWTLEMQDGTRVIGEFEAKTVEFETGTTSLKLVPDEIKSLEFGSSVKLDRIITQKGMEKSGLLITAPIRFRTDRGVEQFEKEDLVKLFRSEE